MIGTSHNPAVIVCLTIIVISVMYIPSSDKIPRKYSPPRDRQLIWTEEGYDFNEMGTYQPEDDGYEVCCVQQGIIISL